MSLSLTLVPLSIGRENCSAIGRLFQRFHSERRRVGDVRRPTPLRLIIDSPNVISIRISFDISRISIRFFVSLPISAPPPPPPQLGNISAAKRQERATRDTLVR